VPEALGALTLSALVCHVASGAAKAWGVPGQTITVGADVYGATRHVCQAWLP
jgi:hypothetical protein